MAYRNETSLDPAQDKRIDEWQRLHPRLARKIAWVGLIGLLVAVAMTVLPYLAPVLGR